ncbi:unnamed protein product [Euphydryas editha]|uniref:Uncharacterized protein n=1 Tax=Euphydryas editha TaxID=104508 RepID=A0AAU9TSI2_EUPED|nr:unnamed protein product [Euphydryas editha]
MLLSKGDKLKSIDVLTKQFELLLSWFSRVDIVSVLFALLSVAAAKPAPGYLSGWDAPSISFDHQPLTISHAAPVYQTVQAAPVIQAAPVVHAAPVIHAAPVAVAKAATSYSSFQRVIHPVAHKVIAQPVVHAAPVVAQNIVHAAPVVAQPIVHGAPIISHATYADSYGHGW